MTIHVRAAVTALAAATAIVSAGCGSSGSGSTASSARATTPASTPAATGASASPASSTEPQAGGRCHTSMLSAHITMGNPGAGQRYAALVLTNVSGVTCRVFGYEGMQLIAPSGAAIPTDVVRTAPGPQLVTVAPGAHVFSRLHWTVVPASDETGGQCEPVPSAVRVTPPDETSALTTAWPGGSVCQHGQIFVIPLAPGTGP